jgi:hypothetical protein
LTSPSHRSRLDQSRSRSQSRHALCPQTHLAFAPSALYTSARIPLATAYKYTSDHEWATVDPATNVATIGITDYAQKALGDVVFVELPEVGTVIASAGMSKR